jgi:hypothetical protein
VLSRLQKVTSGLLVLLFPCSLLAAKPMAIWHGDGKAMLNGASSPPTSAIFPGDNVKTDSHSVASITAEGSSVLVLANSSVEFQGEAVELQKGTIVVSTSRGTAARAGDVTVSPQSNKTANFVLDEHDGTVLIAAHRGNLVIGDKLGTSILPEGQQTTRRHKQKGAIPAATGASVSGKNLTLAAGVAAGIITVSYVRKSYSPKCPGSSSHYGPGCK